jgi:hypothetical protein
LYRAGEVTVPVTDVRQDPRDYVTMTGVLEAFDKQPQSHRDARAGVGRVPLWALTCVFVGLALIGAGLAAQPIALAVWSVIHR